MTTKDRADNFVLIVRQPSTGSNSANELAEDTLGTPVDDQTSVEDISEQIHHKNHLKVSELKGADTGYTSRRGSIFSQTIVLTGTLIWFYLIIPLLIMAFTVGVFFGGILCKLLES